MRATKAIVAASIVSGSVAAQEADWRVSGFTSKEVVLYSVLDLTRKPNGIVQVWSETLNLKAVEQAENLAMKDKAFVNLVAGRIAAYYVPPYGLVEHGVDLDRSIQIATAEEIANEEKVHAGAMMLNEIDCNEKRYRFLSILMYSPTGTPKGSDSHSSEWDYAPPRTNGSRLMKLVCDPMLTAPDNTPKPPGASAQGPKKPNPKP